MRESGAGRNSQYAVMICSCIDGPQDSYTAKKHGSLVSTRTGPMLS